MREEEIARKLVEKFESMQTVTQLTYHHSSLIELITQALRAFGKEKYNEAIEDVRKIVDAATKDKYAEDISWHEIIEEIRKLRKD